MTVGSAAGGVDRPDDNPLARLSDLLDVVGRHAAAADDQRVLAPEVADAVVEAGFAGWFTPEDAGGPDRRWNAFGELASAAAVLAGGCPSAAWCGLVWATSSRIASLLPKPARAEIWADCADVPIAAGLTPGGSFSETTGGLRLSGKWPYLSGVEHADWALLALSRRPGAESPDGPVDALYCAVPAADYTIQDTWHTLGMRGTGSRTAVLQNVFVPWYRTFDAAALWDAPVPLVAAHPPLFAAVAAGAAQAAVTAWAPTAPTEEARLVATADGYVEAARLLLERACVATDAAAATGRMAPSVAARNARDSALAATFARDAADAVFTAGGARVHAVGDPLQRLWRDVRTATSHAALNPACSYPAFADAIQPKTPEKERR